MIVHVVSPRIAHFPDGRDFAASLALLDRHAKLVGMAEATAKERILEALRDLPADATYEDAIERLVFLAKIDEGLAQLDAGQSIPHEEVKRRFGA